MTQDTERILVRAGDRELHCHCFANLLSRAVFAGILGGHTYPLVPFVSEVRTVLDVGANVGAAALFFSLNYPEAVIHALEPARDPFDLLARNAGHCPHVRVHNVGLYREDRTAPLYHSSEDSVTASVGRSSFNTSESETIQMCRADRWVAQQGIDRIDVLKLDTEGCEVAILESLGEWLPTTKVIYVEYHSEEDRLRIDQLLAGSHILFAGRVVHTHRGEFCYVARSAFPAGKDPDKKRIVVSI